MLHKVIFKTNAVLFNFLFIKEPWKKYIMVSTKKKKKKKKQDFEYILFFNMIRNVSWAANQHFGIISERSRDTKEWSSDAENSALKSQ